jgi:site-specific DNA recombinase
MTATRASRLWDKLDPLVTRHLMENLLTGHRTWELLSMLASRRAERAAAVDMRLAALDREATNAEDKLRRLYGLSEDGVAEMDDLLEERITALKHDRDRSKEALSRARGNVKAKSEVTEEVVAKFSELMRQKLREGHTPARKAWLTSIVDRIEVDDGTIRLYGWKDILEQCVIDGATGTQGVRTFVTKWRALQDKSANTYAIEIKA